MAKKNKKKRLLDGTDIALAILAALGGSVLFMTAVLVAGSIMFPDSGKRVTAEAPSAQPSYRGTLPSRAPTQATTPEPVESYVVGDTDAPGGTQTPSEAVPDTPAPANSQAAAQNNAPAPAETQAPTTPTRVPTPTRTPAAQNPGPVSSINPTAPPARQTQAPAQTGNNTQINGRTVYVTPTGEHWHYNPQCNSRGNYYIPQPGEIEARGLTPCSRCVN